MQQSEPLPPAEGSVDVSVETDDWRPMDGRDDDIASVSFVDGVRRVDARLTIDDPEEGPVPGICGTFAVGAVEWDRTVPRSEVIEPTVERWALMAQGRSEEVPVTQINPPYRTEAVASSDPAALIDALQTKMRRAEGELATRLARNESFVIADGPLNDVSSALPVVGYIKTHRVTYLSAPQSSVVAALRPGQRTPLFTVADFKRYSWYVRLPIDSGGHSWTGVVRCEAAGAHPKQDAIRLADRCAALLPLVASESYRDPRAPQNLVPIGGLESRLKHMMGDPAIVYRHIAAAVAAAS